MADYPNQIAIVGAWGWDGQQLGPPHYPIPDYLWRFMPPEVGATSNADLVDVNLLMGQAPRDFS
jgi:hypothetical protein